MDNRTSHVAALVSLTHTALDSSILPWRGEEGTLGVVNFDNWIIELKVNQKGLKQFLNIVSAKNGPKNST